MNQKLSSETIHRCNATATGFNPDPAIDTHAHLADLSGLDRMLVESGAVLMRDHQLAIPELNAGKAPLPKKQDPEWISTVANTNIATAMQLIEAIEVIQPDYKTLLGMLRDIRKNPENIYTYLSLGLALADAEVALPPTVITGYTGDQIRGLATGSFIPLTEEADNDDELPDKENEAIAFTFRFMDRELSPATEPYSEKWQRAVSVLQSIESYGALKQLGSKIMAAKNKHGRDFESFAAGRTFWAIYNAHKTKLRRRLLRQNKKARTVARRIAALNANTPASQWKTAEIWLMRDAKTYIGDSEAYSAVKDLFYKHRSQSRKAA
jgi:hypothetical protein